VLTLFDYSHIDYAAVVEFLPVLVGTFHTSVLLLLYLPYLYPYHLMPFSTHLPSLCYYNAECHFWTLTDHDHFCFLFLIVLFGCSSHDIKIFFHQQDFLHRHFSCGTLGKILKKGGKIHRYGISICLALL
jgi:hypothetical protein